MGFLREMLAIGIEEGLEGQHPSVAFRQPRCRPIDRDGKLDVRDTQKVRAQAEHCRGRGEMTAELTPVAVSRF